LSYASRNIPLAATSIRFEGFNVRRAYHTKVLIVVTADVSHNHSRGAVRTGLCEWPAISSGRCSHRCCRLSQTACFGAGKSGSANAPTATPTIDGRRSGSHHIVDPHTPQKWKVTSKPLSDPRLNWIDDPFAIVTSSLAKKAAIPKTEPV